MSRLVEVRHQGDAARCARCHQTQRRGADAGRGEPARGPCGAGGLVLRNVGLTADLQARLDDLRASRQRLVAAQDQERRRLERNLHDGAQQHLVAIKVKIGLAEMLLGRDPARAAADNRSTEIRCRRCAGDVARPGAGDLSAVACRQGSAGGAGIAGAESDSSGVRRDRTQSGAIRRTSRPRVYFCVLEALQNVQKYAQAIAGRRSGCAGRRTRSGFPGHRRRTGFRHRDDETRGRADQHGGSSRCTWGRPGDQLSARARGRRSPGRWSVAARVRSVRRTLERNVVVHRATPLTRLLVRRLRLRLDGCSGRVSVRTRRRRRRRRIAARCNRNSAAEQPRDDCDEDDEHARHRSRNSSTAPRPRR